MLYDVCRDLNKQIKAIKVRCVAYRIKNSRVDNKHRSFSGIVPVMYNLNMFSPLLKVSLSNTQITFKYFVTSLLHSLIKVSLIFADVYDAEA